MVLAGGTASRKLDLDAFIRQASAYEEWEPGWDKLARMRIEIGQTHALPGQARLGADALGAQRRLRPDRRRRLRAARRPGRRPRRGRRRRSTSTPSASGRSSATPAPGSSKAGDKVADAADARQRLAARTATSAARDAARALDAAAAHRQPVAAGDGRAHDRLEGAVAHGDPLALDLHPAAADAALEHHGHARRRRGSSCPSRLTARRRRGRALETESFRLGTTRTRIAPRLHPRPRGVAGEHGADARAVRQRDAGRPTCRRRPPRCRRTRV